MNRLLLLLVLAMLLTEFGFSQGKVRSYYLRDYPVFRPVGKINQYQLISFYGDDFVLTTLDVAGHIGNPITSTFVIDTCYQQVGKLDSMLSGYLIGNNNKTNFQIEKMGSRKLDIRFNGSRLRFRRISETVFLVTELKSICSCAAM